MSRLWYWCACSCLMDENCATLPAAVSLMQMQLFFDRPPDVRIAGIVDVAPERVTDFADMVRHPNRLCMA